MGCFTAPNNAVSGSNIDMGEDGSNVEWFLRLGGYDQFHATYKACNNKWVLCARSGQFVSGSQS